MGADLSFERVPIKTGKEEETKFKLLEAINKFSIPEFSDNPKKQVMAKLKKEKSKELEEFIDFWETAMNQEFNENGMPIDDEEHIIKEQSIREIMMAVVGEFFDCLQYRDVSSIGFKGYTIYITGGMSYGDSPTESMDTFRKFIYLPETIIKKAGIIWS